MTPIKRVQKMTNDHLQSTWNALKKERWEHDTPGPNGCVTMDDWAELIYSEMSI